MNVKIISDIHLDVWDHFKKASYVLENFAAQRGDVLIIAGDLGEGHRYHKNLFQQFFEIISKNFFNVIMIPGNHEHYRSGWNVLEKLQMSVEEFERIKIINNEILTINGFRFIGSTLWSDLSKESPVDIFNFERSMNDYQVIRDSSKGYRKINSVYTNSQFHKNAKFLKENIQPGDIVITHHAPSYKSVSDVYKGDKLNACYASDLDLMIEDLSPALWIHGHMHSASDYHIYNTRVISNPLGYPGESKEFNFVSVDL